MKPNLSSERLLVDLPNQDGFRFTGVLRSGAETACHVQRDGNGVHRAVIEDGTARLELVGWKPIAGGVRP